MDDSAIQKFLTPHRKTYYFILLILKGASIHHVDLKRIKINAGQIIFVLPHQIHAIADTMSRIEYFKVVFDATWLANMPMQHAFLINPLEQQLIKPDTAGTKRIKQLFQALLALRQFQEAEASLVASYLHTLLAELDHAYFAGSAVSVRRSPQLSHFIRFKTITETEYMNQPDIKYIAQQLGITTNTLYNLVKHQTGKSPKQYLTDRLILEAQRKLYYDEVSVKELAFTLGFNDPDYFSRLFKKSTGQTISQYIQTISKKQNTRWD